MFGKAFRLPGTIFGIPVLLDLTFLLVLPLFAWILAADLPRYARMLDMPTAAAALDGSTRSARLLLGFVAALGLFVSVLIHEFGHALTARLFGVGTKSITLWLLGGVAALDRIPTQRGAEAVVAIVGPLTSLSVAGVLAVATGLTPETLWQPRVLFGMLSIVNVALAIFNMIPALPLDGGRVLRSLLALAMPRPRATAVAGSVSRILAALLAFLALAPLLFGGGTINPMLLLIALFIYFAVGAETRHSEVEQLLRGVRVRDLMTRDVVTVAAEASINDLLTTMTRQRHTGFPVVDDAGRVIGTVGLSNLQDAPTEGLNIGQVMNPQVLTIDERTPALDAFQRMGDHDFGRLVVLNEQGLMSGILTKTDLMRHLRVRAAFDAVRAGGTPESVQPGGIVESPRGGVGLTREPVV